MTDTRTVAELEAEDYTHISATCAGCGFIVQYPFLLMRARKQIEDKTTMAELRRRYVCKRCGSKEPSAFAPWRQADDERHGKRES